MLLVAIMLSWHKNGVYCLPRHQFITMAPLANWENTNTEVDCSDAHGMCYLTG